MGFHQYLQYHSSCLLHIKNSIPYNKAIRINKICSSEKNFESHIPVMKEWFFARGYPEIVVNNQIENVFGKDWPGNKYSESGIRFVTTYHPKI